MPLIDAGKLAAGDTLTWHRPRRGETHTVTVDPAGRLVTAGGDAYSTPDTCASAIAGHPCKGWPNWRTSTGETLQETPQPDPYRTAERRRSRQSTRRHNRRSVTFGPINNDLTSEGKSSVDHDSCHAGGGTAVPPRR
jgi:hypothetical protein